MQKADTHSASFPVGMQYCFTKSGNWKWQSRARNWNLSSQSWGIRALLPCKRSHHDFYPGGTGQCHQLLFLSISLACQYVLVWGWKLPSALSSGNPLGQQRGVYAGKCLVVSLWMMGIEKRPGPPANCGGHHPCPVPEGELPTGIRPSQRSPGDESELWPQAPVCSVCWPRLLPSWPSPSAWARADQAGAHRGVWWGSAGDWGAQRSRAPPKQRHWAAPAHCRLDI